MINIIVNQSNNTKQEHEPEETRYEENEQNTAGLVTALMMGVGFVFGAFASAALCYRSKTMSPHNYWIEFCIYKMCQAKGALIKLYVYMDV